MDRDTVALKVKMDITNIGYADGSFDIIICNHVECHVKLLNCIDYMLVM